MSINLIVSHGKNREIGYENRLVCRLSDDLKRFKQLTLNHTVVMGRKTYQSIGRPLPNRHNIILSKHVDRFYDEREEVEWYTDIHDVLALSQKGRELFIIGGEEVYKAFLPYADGLYITKVEGTFKADTYFPEYNHLLENFDLITEEKHIVDIRNRYSSIFRIYRKKI